MKTKYKITIIAVCAYFGVFFGPVTASNVYCDFISQEMCTSRITGVVLPPLNLIMPSLPSDDCIVNNDGVMEPCHNEAGLLEWPFPPRMEDHPERNCDEQCTDVVRTNTVFTRPITFEMLEFLRFTIIHIQSTPVLRYIWVTCAYPYIS